MSRSQSSKRHKGLEIVRVDRWYAARARIGILSGRLSAVHTQAETVARGRYYCQSATASANRFG